MITRAIGALCLSTWATLAHADLVLSLPIDCELGQDCYIQQYVDHDPSPGASDFMCASLTYDTHKGTDFALPTYVEMLQGVDVLASAPGRVRAVRDGVQDRLYRGRSGEVSSNRACGNGLVIDHDGGWSTQYCHLKRGSVSVAKGQEVDRGTVLGEVGLSGRTQFPHVHLTVRRNGEVVDPFNPRGNRTCGEQPAENLWQTPVAYEPGGILDTGFAEGIPDYADIKAGQAKSRDLDATAPAIVIFGFAFGGRTGDIMDLRIDGPDGNLVRESVRLEKNQAQYFRAAGKKSRSRPWPSGVYRGTVRILREGVVLDQERTRILVR